MSFMDATHPPRLGNQGLEIEMSTVQIAGNTYPVRDYIKSAGGKWDAAAKAWSIDEAAWDKLCGEKPNLMSGCRVVGATISSKQGAFASKTIKPVSPCRSCGGYCYGDCAE